MSPHTRPPLPPFTQESAQKKVRLAEDAWLALGQPTQLPPRPLLDAGVRSRLAWEAWQYKGEK